MNKNLTRQLTGYSGVAGSILLMTFNAHSQILHTDPADILVSGIGSHADLDLNNDGTMDMRIVIKDILPSYDGDLIYLNDFNGNEPILVKAVDYPCVTGQSGVYMAKALEEGFVIKNAFDLKGISSVEIANNDGYYSSNCQQWLGKHDRYLGFRMGPNYHNHFGWIRLSVNTSATKVIVKDWAINLSDNKPILAGQTMRLENPNGSEIGGLEIFSNGTQITIDNNDNNLPLEISVYNMMGQEVAFVKSEDVSTSLQLEESSAGIYIVNIRSAESSFSQRVMIN
jgi:hypothetical protein